MIRRMFFAAVWLASSALAGPSLTTIQDLLYKADGTRFNGTLTISWSSFQAADNSSIITQSTVVRVVDGNLRVQLVPTTTSNPAAYYTVTYNSDGRIQFQETWAVPASAQPLHVRDVRTVASTTGSDTTGTAGPLPESDVIGLTADLGARPLKGPGYAAGRVAIVNPLGAIESVTGNSSDCVHVDGSSGSCGVQPSFMDGDSPAGIVDGSNTSFTLATSPNPASSLAVYRNGMLQKATQDYTLSGATIQFVAAAAPQPGDTLLASYRLSGADGSAPPAYPAPQVLCSGAGSATGSTSLTGIGNCAIPAGILAPGDRVEVHFDLSHVGSVSGFTFEVDWGNTAILQRTGAQGDTLVSGRADAAILSGGAQLNWQSWGAVLPFSAGVASATGSVSTGVTINFQGKLSQAGDTLSLVNYTVVRLP